ncbi:MAG: class I SAM-dependent methyltransferase [Acidimicrobiales bacterium]
MTDERADPVYAMGHSDEERQRLIEQALLHADSTRHLLVDAGIQPGMRVLDVGCGAGDVSMLAASLVGGTGTVIGVDIDASAVALARQRAAAAGIGHLEFHQGDFRELRFGQPFDALIGRFVLMYLGDPVAALKQVLASIRPGGIVAFQEFQIVFEDGPRVSWPAVPMYEQQVEWARQTLARLGVETQMGFKLRSTFLDAGLPTPKMQMHIALASSDDDPGYAWWAHTMRSILPFIEALGVATAEMVGVDTLAERLRQQVAACNAVVGWCPVVSASARK